MLAWLTQLRNGQRQVHCHSFRCSLSFSCIQICIRACSNWTLERDSPLIGWSVMEQAPGKVVLALSLAEFKEGLDDALAYVVQFLVVLWIAGSWRSWWVLSQLRQSMILWIITLQWVFIAKQMMLFFPVQTCTWGTSSELQHWMPPWIKSTRQGFKTTVVPDSWSWIWRNLHPNVVCGCALVQENLWKEADGLPQAGQNALVPAGKCVLGLWADGFAGSIALQPREELRTHSLV